MSTSQNSLRLPDFIGVGPPRTATTWLHEVLRGHVGLPEHVKETDFFVWHYHKGLEWYAAHFLHCPPDRSMGEFSPNYFTFPRAAERIAKDIPRCRIICTFRDPVERLYSHYRKMREGEYFSGSFEECIDKRPGVVGCSRYALHLKTWHRCFGRENVLVLIHDDLKADAQAFLDEVCRFLGIPAISLVMSAVQSKTVNAIPTQPRYRRLARAARTVRDRLQEHGGSTLVSILKRPALRNFLFAGGSGFEPIRPETRARLCELFRPDVEALEEMLRRDLSSWKS